MNDRQRRRSLLLAGSASLACCLGMTGCAHQYHWYQADGCCPQYDYCPPTPPPYTPYCGCMTPFAQYHMGAAYPETLRPTADASLETVVAPASSE